MKKLMLILIFLFLSCYQEGEQKPKYTMKVSNWVGSAHYECESYERIDNVYKLYDKDGEFIMEIALQEGYLIRITKN